MVIFKSFSFTFMIIHNDRVFTLGLGGTYLVMPSLTEHSFLNSTNINGDPIIIIIIIIVVVVVIIIIIIQQTA